MCNVLLFPGSPGVAPGQSGKAGRSRLPHLVPHFRWSGVWPLRVQRFSGRVERMEEEEKGEGSPSGSSPHAQENMFGKRAIVFMVNALVFRPLHAGTVYRE